jgi:serine/threonine protein kinase
VHLGADGELRILDLGVALSKHQPLDAARSHAGTPSYIAPEQYAGAPPSEQMDLYALGVTLYHVLTRKYPYGEIEPFQRPKFGEPTPPTRYRADIPPWLENVILKAVARDPKHRFETADELSLALERGAARPLPPPVKLPLAERDPAALWRAIAIVSISISMLLLYLLLVR